MFRATQIEMISFIFGQSSKHIVEDMERPLSVSAMNNSAFFQHVFCNLCWKIFYMHVLSRAWQQWGRVSWISFRVIDTLPGSFEQCLYLTNYFLNVDNFYE